MTTDDLAKRRLRDALAKIRPSFEASRERGDSGYYVRPELAWELLEAAEAHEKTADFPLVACPPDLLLLGHRLRTQDNRSTGDPLFCVQQKRRDYGRDPAYADDETHRVWHSQDWEAVYESCQDLIDELRDEWVRRLDEEPTEEQSAAFDLTMAPIREAWDRREDVTTPDGHTYEVCYYVGHWEFVSAHFSEVAAAGYLYGNKHHFPHGARVYVTSQYRCTEWIAVQNFLKKLPPLSDDEEKSEDEEEQPLTGPPAA